jgi:hypothetical protein
MVAGEGTKNAAVTVSHENHVARKSGVVADPVPQAAPCTTHRQGSVGGAAATPMPPTAERTLPL